MQFVSDLFHQSYVKISQVVPGFVYLGTWGRNDVDFQTTYFLHVVFINWLIFSLPQYHYKYHGLWNSPSDFDISKNFPFLRLTQSPVTIKLANQALAFSINY